MKVYNLGCSTVKDGCKNYTREDYFAILEQYHELGVRHIEYSHPQTMSEEDAAVIAHYSDRIGLQTWSVHGCPWGQNRSELEFEAQIAHDAKIASILGAQVMVFHPMEKNEDGSIRWEIYEKVAYVAKQAGIELAIETGIPTQTGVTLYRELIALVDRISLSHVGICIDTGHSFLRDNPKVEEVVEAVGDRLKSMHIHDNGGLRDDHQAPGLGFINWYKVIPALKASSYDGPLMMEMTDMKQGRTVDLLAKMTIDREILYGDALFRYIWNHC